MTGDQELNPRVLVLLAARNGAQWIETQLASVLSQKCVDLVVDVRDDGSSDDTRERISALAARDARVRLRPDHAPTGSAAANFFRLISDADPRGFDLVAFCDQDDEWHQDKLSRAASRLANEQADGYSASVLARWPDGRERVQAQNPRIGTADYLFEGAGQGCTFVMTAALFGRLQIALATHQSTTRCLHYHDWTAYAFARTLGFRWVFDPDPVLTYRQHAGNDTGARTSLHGVVRRLAAIRAGWYRGQVAAIADFVLDINPADAGARRWRQLTARRSVAARLERMAYLMANGRRRPVDRGVQVLATLCGWL